MLQVSGCMACVFCDGQRRAAGKPALLLVDAVIDDDDLRVFLPDELVKERKRCIYCHGTGNDGTGSIYYPCPDCNTHEDDDDEET